MPPHSIAIIGAGVSGLTCGVVLSEAGHAVTIFAREIEGTTSDAAAAIWFPYHIGASPHVDRWAAETREVFVSLTSEPEAGVSMIDFDVNGERINVPLVDTTRYLPYLRRRYGGEIVQREVKIDELLREHDLVVNCAGFGARELTGDEELTPGHGVSILTDQPDLGYAMVTDAPLMYVIPRTDDCLLGGYDSDTPAEDRDVEAVMARCRAAVPSLSGRVLAVKHGIRPVRREVRVEREANRPVIHNYGHGGAGFTVSWGCAWDVARLVAAR